MNRAPSVVYALLLVGTNSFAQDKQDPLAAEGYITPPKEIASAVIAPWYKNVSVTNLSPDRSRYIVLERDGNISIADLGRAHLNLGGFQVDTAAQRERSMNSRTGVGLRVANIAGSGTVNIRIPAGARVSDPSWSPDGAKIAFYAHKSDGTWIYIANPQTGDSAPLTATPLKPTMTTTFQWVEGGKSIVAVVRPADLVAPPTQVVASSPKVQQTDQQPKRISAFPSLLQSTLDKALLEFYATSQLARIDVATGKVTMIGKPAMIRSFDAAPDGKFFRVTVMTKPFSYVVPVSSFGTRETIWDETGAEKATLSTRALQLSERTDTAPTPRTPGTGRRGARGPADKRGLSWRPDGAGLNFIQTSNEDDGDGNSTRVDKIILWSAPFGDKDMKTVWDYEGTIDSVRYSDDAATAFVNVTADSKSKILAVDLATKKASTVVELKADAPEREDLLSTTTRNGLSYVRRSGDKKRVYLTSTKQPADLLKDGPYTSIDALELGTGKRENIFKGRTDMFEVPTLLDDDANTLLVARQAATVVPNTFLVNTKTKLDTQITENKDYSPDLTALKRETIIVTRADGFKFQVKVTFPAWATYGVKLPGFFWFYPNEFTSQEAYDKSKRAGNKNLFHQVTGNNKEILARAGYVVVDPDCPIIGPAGKMNDEYVSQLRNNLLAVIDELDRRGWVDRNRLGIGGHSYGAFSTANALVNTPFFKAGIAGDGCYNRTLTPFGFQTEQRQIWEDRELYLDMSPILRAEQMTGALLMYHGMEDQNVGTAPINSERMYAALEALGKPAALYMYPYEDHGQIAKETVLDQWARFVAWLDKWVKHPQTPTFPLMKEPAAAATGARRGGRGTTPP